MSSGKFVLGALVGGALGALVGLLVAPRSGIETRDRIGEEISSRCDDAKGRIDDVREQISDIATDFEETGKKTIDSLTAKVPRGNSKPAQT